MLHHLIPRGKGVIVTEDSVPVIPANDQGRVFVDSNDVKR